MGRSGEVEGNTHHSNQRCVCCPPVGCSGVSSLSPINSHHSTFIHHHSNFWVGRCVVGGLSAGVGETRTIATRETRTIVTRAGVGVWGRNDCGAARCARGGAKRARPPELWSSLGTLLSKRAGLGRAGCVLGKQSLVIKHAKSGFQLIKRLCLIV